MLKTIMQSLTANRNAVDLALRQIDEIREEIITQKAEISRIETAPVPVAEALAAFDVWAASAAGGAMDARGVSALLDPTGGGHGLGVTTPAVRHGGEMIFDARPAVQTLLGLVISTGLPTLRRLAQEHLTAAADGMETMSASSRRKKLAEAQRALLDLELAEEAAIRSLEGAGVPVARRADASPAAVLAADASLPG